MADKNFGVRKLNIIESIESQNRTLNINATRVAISTDLAVTGLSTFIDAVDMDDEVSIGKTLTTASIKVSNLTANRVALSGSSGKLIDSSTLTYNPTSPVLTLTGNLFLPNAGNHAGIGTASKLGTGTDSLSVWANSVQSGVRIWASASGGDNNDAIPLQVADYLGTEYFRVANTGNVGIGSAIPSEKLDVDGNIKSDQIKIGHNADIELHDGNPALQLVGISSATSTLAVYRYQADGNSPTLDFVKSRNATPGSLSIVQPGDELGKITFNGDDGSSISNAGAEIKAIVGTSAGSDTTDMPGSLVFLTSPDDENIPQEALRIDYNQDVGIGTAVPTNAVTNQGALLAVAGIVTAHKLYVGGAEVSGGVGETTPGGVDTQIQYNNGGSFGGSSQLTYNGNTLNISSQLNVTGVTTFGNGAPVEILDTSESPGSTDGALVVHGGIGVSKYSNFGEGLNVIGHTELDQINVSAAATFKDDVEFHGNSGIASAFWDKSINRFDILTDTWFRFGTSSNYLNIYKKASDKEANIEVDSGDLIISAQGVGTGGDVHIKHGSNDNIISKKVGVVELFYANSKKLETSGIGITVTGICSATSFHASEDVEVTGTISATRFNLGVGVTNIIMKTFGVLNDSGNSTIAGKYAGEDNTGGVGFNGDNLTVYGYAAGRNVTSGGNNVFFGSNVGVAVSIASDNTAVGEGALGISSTSNNTALGRRAGGLSQITGTENTFLGHKAGGGDECKVGLGNVFVGASAAGEAGELGNANVIIGHDTFRKGAGQYNTIIGGKASYTDNSTLYTSNNNIVIVYDAEPSTVSTSNEITLGDTNITRLRIPALDFNINSTGVGIGTTNPTATNINTALDSNTSVLAVGVVTANTLYVNGAEVIGGGGAAGLWQQTDVGINTTSDVGIGTTNPTSKLHVMGGARITGVLTTGQIADSTGAVGAASSALYATASGLEWKNAGTVESTGNFVGLIKEEVRIDADRLDEDTDINLADGMVHYFQDPENSSSIPNIRFDGSTTLTSKMSVGQVITVTIITRSDGSSGSAVSNAIKIDGDDVTEEWLCATAPSTPAATSGYNVYTHTIIKKGSSGTTNNDFIILSTVANYD